MLDVRQVDGRC